MKRDRTKECNCWCRLDYCPVNCDVNNELITTKYAKNCYVRYEEI